MEYWVCNKCKNINQHIMTTYDKKEFIIQGLCKHAVDKDMWSRPDNKDIPGHKSFIVDHFSTWTEQLELSIWGSYGIDGNSPLKFKYIKDCSLEHLKSILRTHPNLSRYPGTTYSKVMEHYIIAKRRDENIDSVISS